MIVSAYRVSQTYPSEAGYSTAYMQQYRAYVKAGISNPKPKHRCLIALTQFMTQWKEKHNDSSIILMMDANGDRSDKHFLTFMRENALHDVLEYHSPQIKDQSTYINGTKRLDYILVSEDLLSSGNSAGHTDFSHPFISDHRGVYWDVAVGDLFGSNTEAPKNVGQRGLQLERPKQVEEYVSQLKILY